MPSSNRAFVLLADDDADDRLMVREAFEQADRGVDLETVEDGQALMEFLAACGAEDRVGQAPGRPWPSLILLDLNMPRKNGREALAEIKANPALRRIPVVIFTTSKAEKDIRESYDLGANAYFSKPSSFEELVQIVHTLCAHWLETARLPG